MARQDRIRDIDYSACSIIVLSCDISVPGAEWGVGGRGAEWGREGRRGWEVANHSITRHDSAPAPEPPEHVTGEGGGEGASERSSERAE